MSDRPRPRSVAGPEAALGLNVAVVAGVLSSDPRTRTLPSGSALVSYEVTSTDGEGQRRSVPVVWFDPRRPPALAAGDEVVVVGAVRRRFFRAGGATISRTEVEAEVVARASTGRAERAVVAARAAIDAHGASG